MDEILNSMAVVFIVDPNRETPSMTIHEGVANFPKAVEFARDNPPGYFLIAIPPLLAESPMRLHSELKSAAARMLFTLNHKDVADKAVELGKNTQPEDITGLRNELLDVLVSNQIIQFLVERGFAETAFGLGLDILERRVFYAE